MKKIFLICLLAVACTSFSQDCEEREDKLLGIMGSLSAGFLYNTYGLLESIADGYGNEAYTAVQVTELLNTQKKLADNMIALLEKMVHENAFKVKADKDYMVTSVTLLKGYKIQADLFLSLVKNKSQKNIDAYDKQRNKNWADLGTLMGVKE